MQENDLFDIFPEISKVVHILAFIPACTDLLTLKGHMPTL